MVGVIQARPVKEGGAGYTSKGIGGRSMGTDQGFASRQGNGLRVHGTGRPSFGGCGFEDRVDEFTVARPSGRFRQLEKRVRALFPLGQEGRILQNAP